MPRHRKGGSRRDVVTAAMSPLVEARGVSKHFPVGGSWLSRRSHYVKAVDGIDLTIFPSETVGIVGESGSGKSTLGRLLLRLLDPSAGRVLFENEDLAMLDRATLRARRRDMQIIFQDPYASLNPRMRVGVAIGEALLVHGIVSRREVKDRVLDVIQRVGLGADAYDRYPHEFSGGQRQRIGIARALALGPRFIVADEPVSALDVSISAQIINLMISLRKERNLAFAFISHDLRVVEHVSDRVAVMYLGKIVETCAASDLYAKPLHPYTKALLSAVPRIGKHANAPGRVILSGDVPSPIAPPPGCPFHPRCPVAENRCRGEVPELADKGDRHLVACHLV
jgi:oligopeptide/dipeptide ABC transporter ATP-binding protein